MKNIAQFIVARRKKLKLTQSQLAELAGVGLRLIREIEAGKPTLRCDKLSKVLALFGCRLGIEKL